MFSKKFLIRDAFKFCLNFLVDNCGLLFLMLITFFIVSSMASLFSLKDANFKALFMLLQDLFMQHDLSLSSFHLPRLIIITIIFFSLISPAFSIMVAKLSLAYYDKKTLKQLSLMPILKKNIISQTIATLFYLMMLLLTFTTIYFFIYNCIHFFSIFLSFTTHHSLKEYTLAILIIMGLMSFISLYNLSRLSLYSNIIAAENVGPFTALRKSYRLTNGSAFSLMMLMLIVATITSLTKYMIGFILPIFLLSEPIYMYIYQSLLKTDPT